MEKPEKRSTYERLDFIRPRITDRIERARDQRAISFSRRLRIWLPLLALGIIVCLFLWPVVLPNFRLSDVAKTIPDLVVDNLHFSGTSEKNEPFTLFAAQATRPSALQGIYELTKPKGDIVLNDGAWIDGRADSGRFDDVRKKLWLNGNVQIFHNKGYQVTTDEALIDLQTRDAWGDKDVLIQGNFGTIRGKGFRLLDSARSIIVTGPAKAVLSLRRSNVSGTQMPGKQ